MIKIRKDMLAVIRSTRRDLLRVAVQQIQRLLLDITPSWVPRDLAAQILGRIEAGEPFSMRSSWEHCLAGWTIRLTVPRGAELATKYGVHYATRMIWEKLGAPIPDLHSTDDAARAWLQQQARRLS